MVRYGTYSSSGELFQLFGGQDWSRSFFLSFFLPLCFFYCALAGMKPDRTGPDRTGEVYDAARTGSLSLSLYCISRE
jgi:hypothetical protein